MVESLFYRIILQVHPSYRMSDCSSGTEQNFRREELTRLQVDSMKTSIILECKNLTITFFGELKTNYPPQTSIISTV